MRFKILLAALIVSLLASCQNTYRAKNIEDGTTTILEDGNTREYQTGDTVYAVPKDKPSSSTDYADRFVIQPTADSTARKFVILPANASAR